MLGLWSVLGACVLRPKIHTSREYHKLEILRIFLSQFLNGIRDFCVGIYREIFSLTMNWNQDHVRPCMDNNNMHSNDVAKLQVKLMPSANYQMTV